MSWHRLVCACRSLFAAGVMLLCAAAASAQHAPLPLDPGLIPGKPGTVISADPIDDCPSPGPHHGRSRGWLNERESRPG